MLTALQTVQAVLTKCFLSECQHFQFKISPLFRKALVTSLWLFFSLLALPIIFTIEQLDCKPQRIRVHRTASAVKILSSRQEAQMLHLRAAEGTASTLLLQHKHYANPESALFYQCLRFKPVEKIYCLFQRSLVMHCF